MTDLGYVKEKLDGAIHILATEPGDVRSRLRLAVYEFAALSEGQFPDGESRGLFREIKTGLSKYDDPTGRIGQFEATLKRIQNRTGSNIAEKIWELKLRIDYLSRREAR